ncbi:MAG: DMT family transporter [Atopobiaceae bacterium]|nr:DMT family transporter [Atopobiaceae bacterium]
MKNSRTIRILAVATSCLLWSGSLIASKLSYDTLAPMSLGLIRFALATVAFFVVCLFARELIVPDAKSMAQIALTGILGTTLYFAAENYGVSMLPASTSSLIVGSFPAMTLVLECLIDKIRPQPLKTIGIVLAFMGVAILAVGESSEGGSNVALGCLILMFGGLCWALYNFAMRLVMGRYSALVITAWQTFFGALGFIPFVLVEGIPSEPPSPAAWASLAYLVLGCTVVGFVLYNWGLEDLEPSTATSLSNLIPVFGLVLSALILGEEISMLQLLGGAIVVVGIVLSTQESPRVSAN